MSVRGAGRRRRATGPVLALLLCLLLLAPASASADVVKDAIAAFGSTSFYAAPGAKLTDAAQRRRIESEISDKGVDVHIAELPGSAGPPDVVIQRLGRGAGGGTVVAIAGR